MALTGSYEWLADGVRLLGGSIRPAAPDLIEVDLPPPSWAQLEGRVCSPFFPPPPVPPRLWALSEEAWRAHPEAEWLFPGSGRFQQWAHLAREKAPVLAARWAGSAASPLTPALILLWRVVTSGSGRLAWTLATTTRWPAGPAHVAPAQSSPLWAQWLRSGNLQPAPLDRPPLGFRQALAVTLEALAAWLAPHAVAWAREQGRRWEAERAQVEAYYRALASEQPEAGAAGHFERHLVELDRNLAPRLRARPLLALFLHVPPEALERLWEADTQGEMAATSSPERVSQSGQNGPSGTAARPAPARAHREQSGCLQDTQQPEAQPGQNTVPHPQGPAQAGQRRRGQRQRRSSPDSRPHSWQPRPVQRP
ncbi:MAG TPA: hypothetical protein VIL08_01540 [Limnochorda sp.]